jgi:hypothetical protein
VPAVQAQYTSLTAVELARPKQRSHLQKQKNRKTAGNLHEAQKKRGKNLNNTKNCSPESIATFAACSLKSPS